ncbi:C40 family peptidase [Streptomyces polyrhachis]|uniref:C40 family peptidase n=1 Tax=Streptomyces polyrhachis TaxID=1282885 RepID=A0ABW2GMC4_9ACTN
MSSKTLKTHIPSHRKPRRGPAPLRALRTGVAGGALVTLVAAAAPASAAETASETTAEFPALDATTELPALTQTVREGVEAMQQTAFLTAVGSEAQDARESALKAALKARKAEEARKAEKAREAAAERAEAAAASRSTARANLGAPAATATVTAAPATASGSVGTLLGFLQAQVGKAYVLGATGPSAYDCSGLTQTAFRQIGISLPRTAAAQSTAGTQIPVSEARPGDLLFWGGVGSAYHVAVYLGGGKYLDAANPSKGVVIQEMSYYMPSSAVRVL